MSSDDENVEEDSNTHDDQFVSVATAPRKVGRPRLSYPLKKRRVRGLGRGNKGIKRGPRAAIEPSEEFISLQKQAVNVFVDEQDHDKALDIIQRAIAINPEVYAAHALLSEIYMAKGEPEKALAALFSGAHAAPRDATIWQQVADKCLEQTSIDRHRTLAQAAYCYARIVNFSQDDNDARFQRAAINRELGNYGKAMKDLDKLLDDMPHNSSVLRQVAEVCIETRQIERAKEMYEKSIEYSEASGLSIENAFSWSDINVYVELFGHQDQHGQGVLVLKRLSRWLLGRKAEDYWDELIEDDREWDADDEPRRDEVLKYVSGQFPLDTYGDGLPLELRVKLGIYRLHLGREHRSEAFGHFEWLEPEEDEDDAKIFEYHDLFREAGNALKAFREYDEALRYFEPVMLHSLCNETDFWLAIAASSYVCGKKAQAIECYEAAKASDSKCIEARTQLAKLYKDQGNRDLALENAQESLDIGRSTFKRTERRRYERKEQREQREAAERAYKEAHKMPVPVVNKQHSEPVLSFKKSQVQWQMPGGRRARPVIAKPESRYQQRRRKQNMSVEDAEARRTTNIQSLYSTLKELTLAMREGDSFAHSTWLDCATELIADFRSVRVFFPHERHIKFVGYDVDAKQYASQKKWKKETQTRNATEAIGTSEDPTAAPLDEADIPIPTTESTIPTEYRGISFKAWLDIFLEDALVLANAGQRTQSYGSINAALDCVIWYHEPESIIQIYVCYFSCALALNDAPTMANVTARWFMRQYQFCTDTYRLFAALNLFYKYPAEKGGKEMQNQTSTWRLGACQKFIFRQVKAVDALLPEGYNADGDEGTVPAFMRTNLKQLEKEDAADKGPVTGFPQTMGMTKPKEMDVVLLTLYAQILYAGSSFPNALVYYYRAYALDPKNPMVLLSMALSYAHEMFKRQNANRHGYLMQGLAFFQEYADCRLAQCGGNGEVQSHQAKMEIEFNRARLWQMLGLGDMALKGYEKVLGLGIQPDGPLHGTDMVNGEEDSTDAKENYTMEAAYAASTIYAISGDLDSAREITEKWLVV